MWNVDESTMCWATNQCVSLMERIEGYLRGIRAPQEFSIISVASSYDLRFNIWSMGTKLESFQNVTKRWLTKLQVRESAMLVYHN